MVDIDVAASLRASIDGLAASVRHQADALRRAQDAMDHVPLDLPIMRAGTTTPAGVAVISCGGPARGRQWQVHQLSVAGPIKGAVRLLALAVVPVAPWVQGLKDTTTTRWPAPAFYGVRQLVVEGGETLWVVVTGATATVGVTVTGTAEDYDLVAYGARIAL